MKSGNALMNCVEVQVYGLEVFVPINIRLRNVVALVMGARVSASFSYYVYICVDSNFFGGLLLAGINVLTILLMAFARPLGFLWLWALSYFGFAQGLWAPYGTFKA